MASYVKYQIGTEVLLEAGNAGTDTWQLILSNAAPNVTSHTTAASATELSTSGGYTAGDGVELQQLINTGTGINPSMPVGDNNLRWSNGEKAAIYDDANSSLNVGAWASSHAGLYPFVSWATADMIHVNQGTAIHLKGSVA